MLCVLFLSILLHVAKMLSLYYIRFFIIIFFLICKSHQKVNYVKVLLPQAYVILAEC